MTNIINLRTARKTRARKDAGVRADHNRVAFGRTKDETRAAEAEQARQTRLLDASKIGD